MTRRSVLGGAGLGLAGAAAGLAGGFCLGRSPRVTEMALMASPLPRVEGIIDTHHHMLPPIFVKAIGEAKIAAVMPNGAVPTWSPELDLAVMDEFGIRKAVLSISPGLWTDTPAEAVTLARRVRFSVRAEDRHPARPQEPERQSGSDRPRQHPARLGSSADAGPCVTNRPVGSRTSIGETT